MACERIGLLLATQRLWSAAEVLARPSAVPPVPGVYAWYFKHPPPGVPTDACHRWLAHDLLYVGISPGAPPRNGKPSSRENLRKRLRYHFRGNAEGSTLRLTLGCLLGLRLRRVGSGNRLMFGEQEAELSAWMSQNAVVSWVELQHPWELERNLIATLVLPLNLDQNQRCGFHAQLTAIRKAAKESVLKQRSVY